jgi:hypothetical protein
MRRFVPLVKKMAAPKFLTLTLKRRPLCRANIKFLRNCFTRLRHRKMWTALGGVYQIEVGTVDDLGHPYMDQGWISDNWRAITGDSYIIDIRAALGARDLVKYMSKHLGKMPGPELDDSDFWKRNTHWKHDLINAVLKGTRLVQGFGTLSHVSMNLKGSMCPQCGSVDSITMICPWEPAHEGL